MIKRVFLPIIIVVISLSIILAGCGAQPQSPSSRFQAGFIFTSEPADRFQLANERARLELEDQKVCKTIKAVSSPENASQSVQQLKDSGCSAVFLCDYSYDEVSQQLAESFPDMQFVMMGEYDSVKNLYCYTARLYQAYYLAGMAAGYKTQTGKLGFVASIGGSEAIRMVNAFALGAQLTHPGASVLVDWTNSYADSAAASNVSEAFIAQGCDVLADGQYSAGVSDAAERYGVYFITLGEASQDVDNPYIVGGVEWSLGSYYKGIIDSMKAGTWDPENPQKKWPSMADGVFRFNYYNIEDSTMRQNIDTYRTSITEANYNVFTGPIKDEYGNVIFAGGSSIPDEDLLLMLWFVEGVEGVVPQG